MKKFEFAKNFAEWVIKQLDVEQIINILKSLVKSKLDNSIKDEAARKRAAEVEFLTFKFIEILTDDDKNDFAQLEDWIDSSPTITANEKNLLKTLTGKLIKNK